MIFFPFHGFSAEEQISNNVLSSARPKFMELHDCEIPKNRINALHLPRNSKKDSNLSRSNKMANFGFSEYLNWNVKNNTTLNVLA